MKKKLVVIISNKINALIEEDKKLEKENLESLVLCGTQFKNTLRYKLNELEIKRNDLIVSILLKIIGAEFEFKKYSHTTVFNCTCGKTFTVYHNQYGTRSGGGSCECGAKLYIN